MDDEKESNPARLGLTTAAKTADDEKEGNSNKLGSTSIINIQKENINKPSASGVLQVSVSTPLSGLTNIDSCSREIFIQKFYEYISQMSCDKEFRDISQKSSVPIPVYAAAKYFTDNILPKRVISKKTKKFYDTEYATEEINRYRNNFGDNMFVQFQLHNHKGSLDPYIHSICGVRLYIVQWELFSPQLCLPCPNEGCNGNLCHTRTNFSKNKNLFPIYRLDGQPDWAIIMKYQCNCCTAIFDGNDGRVLINIPEYIRKQYPVYPRYATGKWHLSKSCSDLFEEIMMTYGNGDFFSRLLYNAINKKYLAKIEDFLSYHVHEKHECLSYPAKNGEFLSCSIPGGDALRNLYEQVSKSTLNYMGISDDMRHTREIQSVSCNVMFAQDHTMEQRQEK